MHSHRLAYFPEKESFTNRSKYDTQLDDKIIQSAVQFKLLHPTFDKLPTTFYQEEDHAGYQLHAIYIRPDTNLSNKQKTTQGKDIVLRISTHYKLIGRSKPNILVKGEDNDYHWPSELPVGTVVICNKTVICFINHAELVQSYVRNNSSTDKMIRVLASNDEVDALKKRVAESHTVLAQKRKRTLLLTSEVEMKKQRAAQRSLNREFLTLSSQQRELDNLLDIEKRTQNDLSSLLEEESSVEDTAAEPHPLCVNPNDLHYRLG